MIYLIIRGPLQSSMIVEICKKKFGTPGTRCDPCYFGWVSREHTIQISDLRRLLPLPAHLPRVQMTPSSFWRYLGSYSYIFLRSMKFLCYSGGFQLLTRCSTLPMSFHVTLFVPWITHGMFDTYLLMPPLMFSPLVDKLKLHNRLYAIKYTSTKCNVMTFTFENWW
jgi:hypothetical protein